MKLYLPELLSIDEKTATKNPIRQLSERASHRDGTLATFTSGSVRGFIFQPITGGDNILIVPPKTRRLPDDFSYILGATIDGTASEVDASEAAWIRHPRTSIHATVEAYQEEIQRVLASWEGEFSYSQEDVSRNVSGLRGPQIGALHAIHAHWAVSDSVATIVMPTGTGKTETMLSILVSARCQRVLVIVPTDALRFQIARKFLTLGILKAPNVNILGTKSQCPIVCTLEHIPVTAAEVDELAQHAQVIVTTSSIAGQCAPEIQERLAEHCPYLFIDEAHHAEAPTWSAFKEKFGTKRIVQFTATPFREDGRPLDGTIIFKYPLKKAQEEGYFKPIAFEPIVEFDPKQSDTKIATKAIECLRRDLDKGHIVMARVENVARAKEVFELYNQYPEFNPVQLHTGIKSHRLRDDARRRILSGESRIVICVDMLGEGFDLPELKIAAFHDIRKSLAVTLQLAGRFTRVRADLGDATFIANVADVNVQDELRKLYTRDPDWNALLPELSEKMIGEQTSFQDFMRGFTEFPTEIPLKAVRPANSMVVYRTQCEDWTPDNFRAGIPAVDSCERIHHSINTQEHTLIVVTARRVALSWTNTESLFDWIWDLYVVVWSPEQNLLYVNGSSNASEFRDLAKAITGDRSALIKGQDVFRSFAGINRLRLQNVGLTEQIGRNVRYTGRMGSDVEPRLTQAQRGNAQKSVLAGSGYENGDMSTIGASRKGRIWSHQRDRLDQFRDWCKQIGAKLLNTAIDPDQVLQGTLVPQNLAQRPEKVPISIDWPEVIYTELERLWCISIGTTDYSLSELSINLVSPSTGGSLNFEIASESERVEFELEFYEDGDNANYRFVLKGDTPGQAKHGSRAQPRSLPEFFYSNPPTIWFADGSSLEGNEYVELRTVQPPYKVDGIVAWDWTGVDITKESQGDQKQRGTVQARAIQELLQRDYDVIFDDDNAGEAADVVCIRIVGGAVAPERIEVDFFHCKYSHGGNPGSRIADLYEVCGQAQKSICWVSSPEKKTDLFTHLMRREKDRLSKERSTRFERGTLELLHTIREISRVYPVSLSVSVIQPGLSKANASPDQLQLLGVTENYLMETYQLNFSVIASA